MKLQIRVCIEILVYFQWYRRFLKSTTETDGGIHGQYFESYLCSYRKGYTVQNVLLSLLEKWRISLDKGGYGGPILMDLSKALDTISHAFLLAKLHA